MNCKYPKCKKTASKTWALVDLCWVHHSEIRKETNRYYTKAGKTNNSLISSRERLYYREIEDMIPWSEKRLAEKRSEIQARQKELVR